MELTELTMSTATDKPHVARKNIVSTSLGVNISLHLHMLPTASHFANWTFFSAEEHTPLVS